jgi:hypothetical protein
MLQETPAVGWDYSSVYVHVNTATRLLTFYVLVAGVALIFKMAQVWTILGFLSWRTRRSLDKAADAIQTSDFAKLRAVVHQIFRRAPEAWLREWPVSQPEDASVSETLRSAGHQFARVCDSLARIIRSLKIWAALTLLVLGLYSSSELGDLFRAISDQKRAGLSATFGSLASLSYLCQAGLWLTIAYFVAYWHLTARLDRRREAWACFISKVTDSKADTPKPSE